MHRRAPARCVHALPPKHALERSGLGSRHLSPGAVYTAPRVRQLAGSHKGQVPHPIRQDTYARAPTRAAALLPPRYVTAGCCLCNPDPARTCDPASGRSTSACRERLRALPPAHHPSGARCTRGGRWGARAGRRAGGLPVARMFSKAKHVRSSARSRRWGQETLRDEASLSMTSIPPLRAMAMTQFWFPKSSPHGKPIPTHRTHDGLGVARLRTRDGGIRRGAGTVQQRADPGCCHSGRVRRSGVSRASRPHP